MYGISIGTSAFALGPYEKNPTRFAELIPRLRDLGFSGVELASFGPHPNPVSHPTKRSREVLKETMAANGIAFSGVCPDFWSLSLVNSDDDGTGYLESFRTNLAFAADIGSPMIRVDAIHPPQTFDKVPKQVARSRIVKIWKRAIAEAAGRGLDVVWEFEPGFIFNRPSDIVQLVGEFDEPNFGVLFDTCHAHMIAVEGSKQTGGPVERLKEGVLELARMLRGRIRTVHVGDSDGTVYQGGTSTHVPIGEGRIDFPPILEELAAHGGMTIPWWTLDLSNCENAWEAAASCKAALDRFNKAWLATAK